MQRHPWPLSQLQEATGSCAHCPRPALSSFREVGEEGKEGFKVSVDYEENNQEPGLGETLFNM